MLARHYHLLQQYTRFRYLTINGVCIAERQTEQEELLLFQIRDIYIEVCFDKRYEKINWSKYFTKVDDLEPYLNQMKISNLVG